MEMMAAIKALEALKRPCTVELYSDSAYLINAFTQGWIAKWQKNGWRLSKDKSVKNQDLWQRLLALNGVHQISWHKVKGHSSDEYNNLCDALATEQAGKFGR
jgi:ribonuclease HI